MGFEIDFLPVGEESQSGDAIALRYGDLTPGRENQRVIVVDGGFTDVGPRLVQHIRDYYHTNRVDIVVSTHPDQDHISGLHAVLEDMDVRQLWMHLPRNHSNDLASASKSARWSQLSETLQKSLAAAEDLEDLAGSKGVPIFEPFWPFSSDDGCFTVLGPSPDYYEQLLSQIQPQQAVAARIGALVAKAIRFIHETLLHETLTDDGETTPQNNSSTICLFRHDAQMGLFSGDAGIPALHQAVARLEANGYSPGRMSFVQVPHHGSRRNVGPTILNRLLGPIGTHQTGNAYVSVAPNAAPKHPSKKVTNAFLRRGYNVYATRGLLLWHHHDAPDRGWPDAQPVPFYDEVEHDEDDT
jgi:beta-lactamase superfamily II metal-dependent hydrolase